jgi:molybdopterin molybdotransferase
LIPYSSAQDILVELGLGRDLGTELLPLSSCAGRVLASDLVAPENLPAFDSSAMDGFFVRADDTRGAGEAGPARLPVLGRVLAGEVSRAGPASGPSAIEVMTGAPLPSGGWDAIVKIEDVRVERDVEGRAIAIEVTRPVERGAFIRPAGTDVRKGTPLLRNGSTLASESILALAALGISRVEVRRKPRVAVVSTGAEVVPHDSRSVAFGQVRNSTAPFLMSSLSSYGVDAEFVGTVRDEAGVFEAIVRRLVDRGVDLILTTGAVSMGARDFVRESVERLGGEVLFHRVAIRPGKPVLCARFGGSKGPVLLGLPGNPVSTAVGLRFFAAPFLESLMRAPREQSLRLPLAHSFTKPDGLRCFFKARIANGPNGPEVELHPAQASYQVAPLLEANSWAILDEEGEEVPAGRMLEVRSTLPGGLTRLDPASAFRRAEEGCC